MHAWIVDQPGPVSKGRPLVLRDLPLPVARSRDILVEVDVCAVCRTDLHLAEGDLTPRQPGRVPGHEVVGRVVQLGPDAHRFALGTRVGIAWLHSTCGACEFCRRGQENLCPHSRYTGWDVDGGFAAYAVVPEAFAYALPDNYPDAEVAPLLCAGIIGYRALRLADVPPGGTLGMYGFGASAHLTLQVAVARGATVHVLTRSADARELALQLGAASAGTAGGRPPELLDSSILFAPAGELVPGALEHLRPGGTLALAGIHLTEIPALNYQRHLFRERILRSVTANTRRDGEEFFAFAAEHPLHVVTTPYAFAEADRALADLAADRVSGAAVLHLS